MCYVFLGVYIARDFTRSCGDWERVEGRELRFRTAKNRLIFEIFFRHTSENLSKNEYATS